MKNNSSIKKLAMLIITTLTLNQAQADPKGFFRDDHESRDQFHDRSREPRQRYNHRDQDIYASHPACQSYHCREHRPVNLSERRRNTHHSAPRHFHEQYHRKTYRAPQWRCGTWGGSCFIEYVNPWGTWVKRPIPCHRYGYYNRYGWQEEFFTDAYGHFDHHLNLRLGGLFEINL